MKTLISFYLIILSFLYINSNAIFPSEQSQQELDCINNNVPTLENCISTETADPQYICCFVEGVGVQKCGYIENTEFGLKAYKHIYSGVDNFNIKCEGNFINNIFFSLFLILSLYI